VVRGAELVAKSVERSTAVQQVLLTTTTLENIWTKICQYSGLLRLVSGQEKKKTLELTSLPIIKREGRAAASVDVSSAVVEVN
jgi:hypothetical protein